jgi:alpha,alpha-trehalase
MKLIHVSSLSFAALVAVAATAAAQDDPLSPQRLAPVRKYIKDGWTTLTRSSRDLIRAAPDPKLHLPAGQPWPVYLSAREDRARVEKELAALLTPQERAQIDLRVLPKDPLSVKEHGLLYLPHPYVVPGGRFNEMYGWDSYFIQVGLLRDGEVEKARDLVDNFVYEIEHYGTILNANRTYFLSRSQPPFLTRMILGVYEKTKDQAWLSATFPAVERYYAFWTTEPHLAPAGRLDDGAPVGLSRYYDLGEGPGAEVVSDEKDAQGRTHYDRAREYYRTHQVADYDVARFYDAKRDELTPLFYKGDRSMRESGFDPSSRFGPFSVDIVHYSPVCLNALLYVMEEDAARITAELRRPDDSKRWTERAGKRKAQVDRFLWDEKAGLYLDYNFEAGKRRDYPFATTFYPLWAGMASPQQARRVLENLKLFEAPGGVLTSTQETGNQWDAPFGWGPLQIIAVDGLRRYGHTEAADRLARKFVGTVVKEFEEHGVILEKYDLVRRESDVSTGIRFGYSANQIGFGWTNAAVLELLAGLDRAGSSQAPPTPRR